MSNCKKKCGKSCCHKKAEEVSKHVAVSPTVNVEIDYEKLAAAITAQKVLASVDDSAEMEKQSRKKMNFFKLAYYIIFNKRKPSGLMTAGLLGDLMALAFNSLAVFGGLFFLVGVYVSTKKVIALTWNAETALGNILAIVIIALILWLSALLSLVFRGVANEMADEEDRNYVVAVFSGLTGFAALIISLIALCK